MGSFLRLSTTLYGSVLLWSQHETRQAHGQRSSQADRRNGQARQTDRQTRPVSARIVVVVVVVGRVRGRGRETVGI